MALPAAPPSRAHARTLASLCSQANHKVAISDKHFLFVDGVEADPATVKLGQSLATPDGPSPIVAIAKETHAGAYHLVTPSGAYYVDGVAASTYVAYIPHAAWKVGA